MDYHIAINTNGSQLVVSHKIAENQMAPDFQTESGNQIRICAKTKCPSKWHVKNSVKCLAIIWVELGVGVLIGLFCKIQSFLLDWL